MGRLSQTKARESWDRNEMEAKGKSREAQIKEKEREEKTGKEGVVG